MGLESFKSFQPDPENERAKDEEKERGTMDFHSPDNLHDEEGSGGINEATGKQEKTKAVDGADEQLPMREINKEDPSEDMMGSIKDKDATQKWLDEMEAKLKEGKEKGDDFKKAA